MVSRSKSTSLRDRHTETTRGVILDALVELLAEKGAFDFSYFDLSRRAGVAVRTIYRHFPKREDLLDALTRRLDKAMAVREYPRTREDLTALVRRLFPLYDSHAPLVAAQLQAGLGRARAKGRNRRASVMQELLALSLPHLPPERLRAVGGVLTCLISAAAWQRLREDLGLDGTQAGEVTAWAIDALWQALEEENATSRRRAGRG